MWRDVLTGKWVRVGRLRLFVRSYRLERIPLLTIAGMISLNVATQCCVIRPDGRTATRLTTTP